jgi:hypothetical protein
MFIVTGQKFVEEACRSAASVRQWMPDIPITMFADRPLSSDLFDRVVEIRDPQSGPEVKVHTMARSPYRETLFLDSDTILTDDVRELFLLLERFDIAATHAPYRAQYQVAGVPDCFPEFNTGVVLFRQSDQTRRLFERWAEIYREDLSKTMSWLYPDGASWYRKALPNQPSFRRALYESALRIATLPPEYNCRLPFPGFVHHKVKIIHGRADSPERIARELNRTMLPRVHIMRWGRLKTLESAMPPGDRLLARLRWSLHHRGIFRTAATTVTRLWKGREDSPGQ